VSGSGPTDSAYASQLTCTAASFWSATSVGKTIMRRSSGSGLLVFTGPTLLVSRLRSGAGVVAKKVLRWNGYYGAVAVVDKPYRYPTATGATWRRPPLGCC
jgi:hypothetical protein